MLLRLSGDSPALAVQCSCAFHVGHRHCIGCIGRPEEARLYGPWTGRGNGRTDAASRLPFVFHQVGFASGAMAAPPESSNGHRRVGPVLHRAVTHRPQQSLIRFNCADSLDRTNIASYFFAVQASGFRGAPPSGPLILCCFDAFPFLLPEQMMLEQCREIGIHADRPPAPTPAASGPTDTSAIASTSGGAAAAIRHSQSGSSLSNFANASSRMASDLVSNLFKKGILGAKQPPAPQQAQQDRLPEVRGLPQAFRSAAAASLLPLAPRCC